MDIKSKICKLNNNANVQHPPTKKKIKIISKNGIKVEQSIGCEKKVDDSAPTMSYLSGKRSKIVPRNINLVKSYKVQQKFKKADEMEKRKNTNKYRKKTSKMDISQINSVNNDIEYIKWKKLDSDVKKEKITDFYGKIDEHNNNNNSDIKIDVKIKTLFALVDKNKFFLKKDLQYDKINQRIENIFIFEEEGEKRGYINDLQRQQNKELKKQKKSIENRSANKKAVKKLFK